MSVHAIRTRRLLPTTGKPGDVYLVNDEMAAPYVVCPDGEIVKFDRLLVLKHTTEHGERGQTGESGRPGIPGRPGRDGRDGAPGAKGEPGSVTYIGPDELAAAVEEVRAELVAERAKWIGRILERIEQTADGDGSMHLAHIHLKQVLAECTREK